MSHAASPYIERVWGGSGGERGEAMSSQNELRHVILDISGMTCAACGIRIEKAVGRMEGVEQIHVNLAMNRASVAIVPERTSVSQIETRIRKLGFTAQERSVDKAS